MGKDWHWPLYFSIQLQGSHGNPLQYSCLENPMGRSALQTVVHRITERLKGLSTHQFSSVQSLSHVRLFVTPWTTAHQASLSITNSRSLLKLMSIRWVMPSSHLILCHPLLLLPLIPPSIRVFSVSASTSVFPMNTQDSSPLGWTGWISLQYKGLSRVFSNTTVQKHQFFSTQISLQSNAHIHIWPLEKP